MGDMSKFNQKEVEDIVNKISNLNAMPRLVIDTILVTNPHLVGGQTVFISTSALPTPLVNSGIAIFKNRKTINRKITTIVNKLKELNIDYSDRFILEKELLPTANGESKKRQKVWRITYRGFISLFMHLNGGKVEFIMKELVVDAVSLVIDTLLLLQKRGHADLIEDLVFTSEGELLVRAQDLLDLQTEFSFKEHMIMLEDMQEFGMKTDF